MPSQIRTNATILAHHLYDFAECEHRIALDVSLERSRRTPPDEAMELLFEKGRQFERQIVEPLGYPTVELREGDWEAAHAQTIELMRAGVPGIDQGVLIDGGRLARPDLLERVPGASTLGEHYYQPGDVKSARTARSDAALQVGFAALLLAKVQGRRPESGFLILGDGRREEIDLEAIRYTIDDAVARAERIVGGEEETRPFYSVSCARCRWRGECVPRLQEERDLSFVHGLTRSRNRVLRRHGVCTIDELATADVARLVEAGVPGDGLERAQAQARALVAGKASRVNAVKLPRGARRECYLRIEVNPLDDDQAMLLAWGEGAGGTIVDAQARVLSSAGERSGAWSELIGFLEATERREEPIYAFGSSTTRALEAMADVEGLPTSRAGDALGRIVDLAPWVRRAGVFPVFHYRFDEVAAVAVGSVRPSPASPDDAAFVLHAALGGADDASVRERLVAMGLDAVRSLFAIRMWLGRSS